MVQTMSNQPAPKLDSDEPTIYRIRIRGQLDCTWADWFGGLIITPDDGGTTLLTSPALDQAALHGLLKKIRDLGLPLISINPIESERVKATSARQNQASTQGTEE
jgi:hypothetical protein